jgi:hypothetical protein
MAKSFQKIVRRVLLNNVLWAIEKQNQLNCQDLFSLFIVLFAYQDTRIA